MYLYFKRLLDIVLSIIVLVIGIMPMALIYLLIILESPGGGIYRQKRYGKDRKVFEIYKFRTMRKDAPNLPTNNFRNSKTYITKVGAVLRKTSLDELPQLVNVIKGDMSLVGPRPGSAFNEENLAKVRQKFGVFAVRPGITGWAQINGRDQLAHDEVAKAEFDKYYVENIGLWLDIKCLFGTVWTVFTGKGYQEGVQKKQGYEQKR